MFEIVCACSPAVIKDQRCVNEMHCGHTLASESWKFLFIGREAALLFFDVPQDATCRGAEVICGQHDLLCVVQRTGGGLEGVPIENRTEITTGRMIRAVSNESFSDGSNHSSSWKRDIDRNRN
ncbi:hypothetical protein AVEN_15092-1 [Araneus ventricosus]|uniref:Uncharacterized protein n=1 Tax=Araneus ventricosus TaxID=182803 RepID=A0A4Y2QF02_ARAVE|nr:hypothetical protein AVEN_15092-1 [Araneus ventricosus]